MKKILEKLLFITFAGVIIVLGYLIIHFYVKNSNAPIDKTTDGSSFSGAISNNNDGDGENNPSNEPLLSAEEEAAILLRRQDTRNFSNEEYTTALLSMFSTETFDIERFYYYTARICMIAKHPIADLDDFAEMFLSIPGSLENLYMIISPEKIASDYSYDHDLIKKAYQEKMIPYLLGHPDTTFFLTLPYYSLSYLQNLSAEEQTRLIDSYYEFYDIFSDIPNALIYFWGSWECLIANPGNYDTDASCVAEVSEKLSCFWFDRLFVLSDDNIDEQFAALKSLMQRESPNELLTEFDPVTGICDHSLEAMDVIFFGDSVVGNFTGPLSLSGAVEGLSGAHTYNLAIGGTGAAMQGNKGDKHSLNVMVDAFIAKDISAAADTSAEKDFARYLEDHQKIVFRKPCFVLYYGLNDYFAGVAVEYPDSSQDNIYTFKGAIYTAVKKLKDAYPVSTIIVNTPNLIEAFDYGTGVNSEEGEELAAYAQGAAEVAKLLDVLCLDNYTELGLTPENMDPYMRDGIHPGELGRYLIGKKLIQKLTQ